MSSFLILPLGFLLGGSVVSFLFARLRPRYSADSAAIASILALIVWLLAGRNLPLQAAEEANEIQSGIGLWRFAVNGSSWWLSFSIFLLLVASLVIMITAKRYFPSGSRASFRRRLAPTFSLLMVVAVLVSLWSVTLPAVATGWTMIALTWALLLWSARKHRRARAEIIVRAGAMLLSLLFLGLAAASQPDLIDLAARPESWSDQAKAWAILAAVVQLGAFPFHWWRSKGAGFVIGTVGLASLAPSAAGAQFMARIVAIDQESNALLTLLLTALGLIGIIYGAGAYWSAPDKRLSAVRAIAISQIGLILLAGAWANVTTVTLLAQVLVLAVGGLYLGITWPGSLSQVDKVPLWIGAAAIVGVPLTAGFVGLSSLYGSQISDGSMVLALVTALLMMPVSVSIILQVWEIGEKKQSAVMPNLGRVTTLFAFFLLALGLIVVPSTLAIENEAASWLLILLSLMGAAAISWYLLKNPELGEALIGAFRIHLPMKTAKRIVNSVATGASIVVRETAAILEGEGGMLWLLLLVVIFWLARVV